MVKQNGKGVSFWGIAILLGVAFNSLFWGQRIGITFPVYTVACLMAGLFLAWRSRITLHKNSLLLMPFVLIFATMVIFRMDPLTTVLNLGMTLVLMGLLANTAISGAWPRYAGLDYVRGAIQLVLDAAARPLIHQWNAPESKESPVFANRARWTSVRAILRGAILAVPLLIVFSCLFSSADPIFAKRMQELFNVDRLPETILRLAIILAVSYAAVGVFLHAFIYTRANQVLFAERNSIPAWLGPLEAAIVLGAVNALFLVFVAIQFRYLFGGGANVNVENYSYSEYAVRGFWELLTVAVLSLLMILGLHTFTKRAEARQGRIFSALAVLLMGLVQIILYSALTRLHLYESAYGFSRLRTYAHVFLVWIGVLFFVVILWEVLRKTRFLSLSFLMAAFGFAISLNAINVDDFIVRQNVARAGESGGLDTAYLASLSADAVPAMSEFFQNGKPETRTAMGVSLVCYRALAGLQDPSWQSYRWPEDRATGILTDLAGELAPIKVKMDNSWPTMVVYQEKEYPCQSTVFELER